MLAYFVIRFESIDSDDFVAEFRRYNPNGVFVIYNYNGEIKVAHAPERLRLKPSSHFFRKGHWSESRWVKWPNFILKMSSLLVRVAATERIEHFFIPGGDVLLWVAQLLKKLGRIQKTTVILEDWSLGRPVHALKDRMNAAKAWLNDWLLMHMDTTTIIYNRKIFEARARYWKNPSASPCVLMEHPWAWFLRPLPPKQRGTKILLFGNLWPRIGVEKVFDLLPELHQKHGFTLKVIGPVKDVYLAYKAEAERRGLGALIEWIGFVPLHEVQHAFSDCFCGLFLREDAVNESTLVSSGRVLNYMQYGVVPVVTEYAGVMVDLIREKQFGVICTPETKDIENAILEAYRENSSFVERIAEFFAENPYKISAEKILNPPLEARLIDTQKRVFNHSER